jgi:hypothetical protein
MTSDDGSLTALPLALLVVLAQWDFLEEEVGHPANSDQDKSYKKDLCYAGIKSRFKRIDDLVK